MKRILLTALIALVGIGGAQAAIISALPNNIQNGQPADATKLMANFNQIVNNVNSNAAELGATNTFTLPQIFSGATTAGEGVIASQVQNEYFTWLGVAGGTGNALTASAPIVPTAYQAGQRWTIQASAANTGAVTIDINGLGVRAITKFGGAALVAGDIVSGQTLTLEDDGVRLQMINPAVPAGLPYVIAGGTPNAITATYASSQSNLTVVDGLDLTASIPVANTGTPVTFTPTLNGTTAATWNVVKYVSGSEVAVAVGDIQGIAWLKADTTNSVWVLMNPATLNTAQVTQVQQQGNPPGTLIDYTGNTCPVGYLQAPTTATNISRTTYAALFAAIGTTWGTGDGSTTFGEPYFPANYVTLQPGGAVGTQYVGQVIAHSHQETTTVDGTTQINGAFVWGGSGGGAVYNMIPNTASTIATINPQPLLTGSTGGSANLAAGVYVLKCIKY